MRCSRSSKADWARRASDSGSARAILILLALTSLCAGWSASARAAGQRDPALAPIVQRAISHARCFIDRFDAAVWYTLMEPRLERYVPKPAERLNILKQVYCVTHQRGASRLPPGLVLAVMQVESGFNRWAVSASGAVGLMQIMPYWPERLGLKGYELVRVAPNIRMGCAILRYYLRITHDDVRLALEEYNGSVGHHGYPDRVLLAWEHWSGADDLGFSDAARSPSPGS
jgi:soluble lytic murein transglycosylase-like protein